MTVEQRYEEVVKKFKKAHYYKTKITEAKARVVRYQKKLDTETNETLAYSHKNMVIKSLKQLDQYRLLLNNYLDEIHR